MRPMSTAVPVTSRLAEALVPGPGMESGAVSRLRQFFTRMAGFCRGALATAACAAILAAPIPASAQLISPTGATLPRGLPVLVQWTPSFWPSPTVDIILNRVVSGGWYPVGAPTPVNNSGQAYIDLPESLVCNPADIYMIHVEGALNNGSTKYKNGPNFKLSCNGGSITVVKTVFNDSGRPIPNGTFQIDVSCGPNGPNTTLALSSASGSQASVMHIPLGRQCTINEQAPKAPPRCRWLTTYPQGKSVVVGNLAYQRAVHNRLSCQGAGPVTGTAMGVGGALNASHLHSAEFGALTILKKVINSSTSFPPPNVSFQVQVTCTPGGPIVPITLSPANNFLQVVDNIPAGSACNIFELAPTISPELARDCRWETIYPDGQNVVMPNPATALKREVINRWSCK